MEFDDLISENITRDAAEKLLTQLSPDEPPAGAVERILAIDIDSLTPRGGPDWVAVLPDLGMQREALLKIIQG